MPATAVETAGANGVADKLASATLVESNGKDEAQNGGGGDESGAEDEEEVNGNGAAAGAGAKKKKKKSGAAKKKAKAAKEKAGVAQVQSEPPRVGLTKIFLDGCYPMGEFQDYDETKFTDDTRSRRTPEELRERERLLTEGEGNNLNLIRRAAEAHRQVRAYAQKAIKPGMSMTDIVHVVEDGTRAVIEEDGFEAGIGFPTGVSLNECAAHYTPNAGDKRILQQGDVLKVDFGVHVQGRIVDSAFTLTFEDQSPWQPLLDAVKAATNEGVKQSGIDARLGEIGASIQEVMESHEFEALGKTHQVKCVKNLNGHSIDRYRIHGGKSVPIVAVPNLDQKMEEGEYFAIETFGSTGKGYVMDSGDCSHYARKVNPPHVNLRVASARPLLHTINKNFGSLPFCRRYLDRLGEKNYLLGLKHLVSQGIVQDYPPLSDIPGSMTAQYEHTIYLGPSKKEVVSRGEDY